MSTPPVRTGWVARWLGYWLAQDEAPAYGELIDQEEHRGGQ
ncbi:hypothetical protein [Nocardia nova]